MDLIFVQRRNNSPLNTGNGDNLHKQINKLIKFCWFNRAHYLTLKPSFLRNWGRFLVLVIAEFSNLDNFYFHKSYIIVQSTQTGML